MLFFDGIVMSDLNNPNGSPELRIVGPREYTPLLSKRMDELCMRTRLGFKFAITLELIALPNKEASVISTHNFLNLELLIISNLSSKTPPTC